MIFFLPAMAHDENVASKIAEQQHRDILTRQRLSYIRQRQAAIDALSEEDKQAYELAKAALKKSFLALVRTNTTLGVEGKAQALAVRALSHMMPKDVITAYHKDMPIHQKMLLMANRQLLWDQQCAEEQDPKFSGPNLGLQDFETTFNAKEAVKKQLQDFPDRRAYVAAYQKVDEEIHDMVQPPYNSTHYNLDKLQRMKDGLDSLPPDLLVKWTKKYDIDDVALMCDVATLGLQADFADHLAKQPIKKATAIMLAGAAATTYVATQNQEGGHPVSISLAAVATLLAFSSFLKRMHMKAFTKRVTKKRNDQVLLYGLRPMVADLREKPLPPATTLLEQIGQALRETGKETHALWNAVHRKETGNYQK
ncbi:MAG: hypothetical protein II938_01665 [Alphaproteobacteria bacterium]|nr:hypothetical protein [Alphaproteobacteria bacterium]